ncbi:plakophilin-3 [Platysternon megacephalum]|uniref:Plakophilin-3 n=1 Tax=Platysternon megacephalum TaxID=55544 RepID=A0A4D9DNL6_9SAUR|nr:plakophilin-3 [Platysternon megacephalum]
MTPACPPTHLCRVPRSQAGTLCSAGQAPGVPGERGAGEGVEELEATLSTHKEWDGSNLSPEPTPSRAVMFGPKSGPEVHSRLLAPYEAEPNPDLSTQTLACLGLR